MIAARYQALFSFPLAGADGALKVMTTKAMDTAQLHAGGWRNASFTFDVRRDGYDLLDANAAAGGNTPLSFIRTSDGGCFDQKISRDQSTRRGGWLLYGLEVGTGGALNHDIRIERLSADRPAGCGAVSADASQGTRGIW